MQKNQYVHSPKKNSTFIVVFVILLLIIIVLSRFVGHNLLSENEIKQVEEKKNTITDNKEEIIDKKDAKDEKENEDIDTNVNYYEIYRYKFPVPKELVSSTDLINIYITDGNTFQLQFSLSSDNYSSVVANPEYYKQEFEKTGVTITKNYEKKYLGKSFYLFKIVDDNNSAFLYLTEVDDDTVGIGIIMATSLSAYEKGLNYVSSMVKNSDKNSSFADVENGNGLSGGLKVNKDIFNNTKK